MSVIDEVKQRIDITEVIGQYTTLTKSGRTFRALCPFHSEKRPSFFVYPEQQSWHCFGACNTGGDAFSFVMKKENFDFGEALRLLAGRAGVTIPSRFEQDARKDEKERLYLANEAAAQYFHNLLLNSPEGERARNYVAGRALSASTVMDFQLGFSPNSWEALKVYLMERGYTEKELLEAGLLVETDDGKTHDRFRNRLMFPIRDTRGRTTGFGARALDDSMPKYLNSPQTPIFDKSGNLYGLDLAAPAIRQQDLAVMVEGYMDAITAHQNGLNNVVAGMGIAVTERQVSSLKRLTRNLVLALDADAAGEEAMLRGITYENVLESEVRVILLPEGKDPDDVIREDPQNWQRLLEGALPVLDYTFNMVSSQLDLTTARDKSRIVDRLLPIIAEIKDEIRIDHYMTKLSRLTKIDYRKLENAFITYRAKKKAKKLPEKPPTYARHPLHSNPAEEDYVALLLRHPDIKAMNDAPLPEYFENSENREIFVAWQRADDLESLREKLDSTLWEHLDALINRDIIDNQIEQRHERYVLRLREDHLKSRERKREAVFSQEVESTGTGADLAKLEEEGIEPSIQLREVFAQRARSKGGKKWT